jgi:hypothetical protein
MSEGKPVYFSVSARIDEDLNNKLIAKQKELNLDFKADVIKLALIDYLTEDNKPAGANKKRGLFKRKIK